VVGDPERVQERGDLLAVVAGRDPHRVLHQAEAEEPQARAEPGALRAPRLGKRVPQDRPAVHGAAVLAEGEDPPVALGEQRLGPRVSL
jgi:hypothetical protein